MEKIYSLHALNDDQENRKIITKLPQWIVSRWSRIVYEFKESHGCFPPFSQFVRFMTKESDIACDPVFSKDLEQRKATYERNPKPIRGSKVFATSVLPVNRDYPATPTFNSHQQKELASPSSKVHQQKEPSPSDCVLCNKRHDLDVCKEFLKKPINERKKYAFENKLCFGCLQSGHTSMHCTKRKSCSLCQRSHPTSLHDDYIQRANSRTASQAKTHTSKVADGATSHCTKAKEEALSLSLSYRTRLAISHG